MINLDSKHTKDYQSSLENCIDIYIRDTNTGIDKIKSKKSIQLFIKILIVLLALFLFAVGLGLIADKKINESPYFNWDASEKSQISNENIVKARIPAKEL